VWGPDAAWATACPAGSKPRLQTTYMAAARWAHVRREFVEVEESFPKRCGEVIDLIGELFLIERECPQQGREATRSAGSCATRSRGP
jgi:hypothetical protein